MATERERQALSEYLRVADDLKKREEAANEEIRATHRQHEEARKALLAVFEGSDSERLIRVGKSLVQVVHSQKSISAYRLQAEE